MIKLLVVIVFLGFTTLAHASDAPDPRSFMHGIAAVQNGTGGARVFFSSSGLPPRGEDENGNWQHDIYVANWQPGQKISTPRPFITKPEAQEPVDAAQSEDGQIMLTVEDGWDTYYAVEQRYSVYDPHLRPVKPYPNTVSDYGHSGHIAAVGNRFVLFYSTGWINGGGVDNLGTGNGVSASIYESNGRLVRDLAVVAHGREWWPLVAGSAHKALLLWQGYIEGQTYATLKMSMLDPVTGGISPAQTLHNAVQYYTYATSAVVSLDRFIITGTSADRKGFAFLIDTNGNITAKLDCMPAVVREAKMLVIGNAIYIPTADNRLLKLTASPDRLSLSGVMPSPLIWSTVGNLGLPDGPHNLHWFSLTPTGLQDADFDLRAMATPAPADTCK